MKIEISPEILAAATEAMRELQVRYEAEAAAFSQKIDCPEARRFAVERAESAEVAKGLYNFFTEW